MLVQFLIYHRNGKAQSLINYAKPTINAINVHTSATFATHYMATHQDTYHWQWNNGETLGYF
jgi:hypothetical protein